MKPLLSARFFAHVILFNCHYTKRYISLLVHGVDRETEVLLNQAVRLGSAAGQPDSRAQALTPLSFPLYGLGGEQKHGELRLNRWLDG